MYLKHKASFLFFISMITVSLHGIVIKKRKTPKLTVIIVIDQFAHHYLPKLRSHLHHGIHKLLTHGIVYENAHHAHSFPETAPGHCSLNTGVFPKDHGIVGNQWINSNDEKIHAVDEKMPQPLIADDTQQQHIQKKPCSAHHILVDGVSEQFCMGSTKAHTKKVFSISIKARAAIGTANKIGKAIWFDDKKGLFVSSQPYFDKEPTWLHKFNAEIALPKVKQFEWKSCYPENHAAYAFPFIRDYEFTAPKKALAPAQVIPINHESKNPFEWYVKSPLANQHILDLSLQCLDANLSHTHDDAMMLWVCLSPLDLAGHIFGPDSFECIDQVYHLDKQIGTFISRIERRYGANNVLFILTADHGIQPMQELSYKKGITNARRIMSNDLITRMNAYIEEIYGVPDIVIAHECSHFFLNEGKKAALHETTRNGIITNLKNMLMKEPGIKRVWTQDELVNAQFKADDLEQFYKNSLHEEKCGDLICMPEPYCLITPYPTGCSHATPYDYDTHVPLALYQRGNLMKKTIHEKVWITQLAGTLSRILGVSRPSASGFNELPGIF